MAAQRASPAINHRLWLLAEKMLMCHDNGRKYGAREHVIITLEKLEQRLREGVGDKIFIAGKSRVGGSDQYVRYLSTLIRGDLWISEPPTSFEIGIADGRMIAGASDRATEAGEKIPIPLEWLLPAAMRDDPSAPEPIILIGDEIDEWFRHPENGADFPAYWKLSGQAALV